MALTGLTLSCEDRSAPGGVNRISVADASNVVFATDFTFTGTKISSMTLDDDDFVLLETEEEVSTATAEGTLENNWVDEHTITLVVRNITEKLDATIATLKSTCGLVLALEDNGDSVDQHRVWLYGCHEQERVKLTSVAYDFGTSMGDKKSATLTFMCRTRNPKYEFTGTFPV